MAPSALKHEVVRTQSGAALHSDRQDPSRRQRQLAAFLASPVLLVVADALALSVVVSAVFLAVEGAGLATGLVGEEEATLRLIPSAAFFVGLALVCLAIARAYRPVSNGRLGQEWPRMIAGLSVALVLFLFAVGALDMGHVSAPEVGLWALSASVVTLLGVRLMTRQALRPFALQMNGDVLVIGTSRADAHAIDRWRRRGVLRGRVAGLITVDRHPAQSTSDQDVRLLGGLDVLPSALDAVKPSEVFVAVPMESYPRVQRALSALALPPEVSVRIALGPLLDGVGDWRLDQTGGESAIHWRRDCVFPWAYERGKRAFDLAVALVGIVLSAPLLAAIAIAIKLDSPGPVFFRQTRIGRGGVPFDMYKFRSMRVDADSMVEDLAAMNEAHGLMFKIRRDPRITRVGRVIRKLSLDELPQFFNVLNGTMSLVGPRPPLPREVEQYEPHHRRRLEAIPGITGLWQVNRGPEISFEEMVELDVRYIREWSFLLDIAIILRTVPIVLTGRGAY